MRMYEISITTHFSAAHHLANYDGPCADLHGHNWGVEVFLRGEKLDELGMLVDFSDVKQAVADVLKALDHGDLNAQPAFAANNPTSENIAHHLFNELSTRFTDGEARVHRVTVHETPGNGVSYSEEA